MVSVILLTTEEVLQTNSHWVCLDATWTTEDLEPFEEVKAEHMFSKPLTRDVYYAKYPDIPRSESEDENSYSVHSFRRKHQAWKSKIILKKLESRRNSTQSVASNAASTSVQNISPRVSSIVFNENEKTNLQSSQENDEKIRAFFLRLIESVPSPPIDDSRVQSNLQDSNDLDLPSYDDFAKEKISGGQLQGPTTSTMKRPKRKERTNSLKSDTDGWETWQESIYGVSAIMDGSFVGSNHDSDISWADVINMCGIADRANSAESLNYEKIISRSHLRNFISPISQEEDVDYDKFAVHKLGMSLKAPVPDSSSLHNFSENDNLSRSVLNNSAFGTLYRLAPCDDPAYEPPENELQKNSDRVLSEHELRVQRSLQKLNVPEWYKNAPAPREGFLLRKRLSDASASAGRWSGLNSKTTSLGSLGANAQPPPPQLSPHTTSFGRWSTSRLNSNQTSPCSSTRSSIRGASPLCSPSTRSSFSARQPYLGWRSQERLNATPRTPHERLACSLLRQTPSSKASEEIQTSIKEVTSAIVHYVSGLEPSNGDLDDVSPRSSQKLYWLESSFVGTKPLESPRTPLVTELPPPHPRPPSSLRLEHRAAPDWQDSQRSLNVGITKPSPGSTTLEDVLDSLLGLPSQPARIPTPQPSPRKSASPHYALGGKSPRYEQLASSGHSSASAASRFLNTPSDAPSSFTDPSPEDRAGRNDM
ncbi:unnamed protein product [Pieris brassicae]|uniref:Uncharacterized protein n=1 Tax=Pieris brassicae TaxID=7116 RepID=A0A9P0TMQ1_PIEBR|nr:unnamed protein product [Pieris brassicae]